ncbi:hypothetical protein AWC38_SpisGene21073 [Stylophora pistillata]|uniref:Rho termination factor-like N-terminal domain-containing protein n=1 Tax=Stylophora pistillata TaxID=50429 RepID=A0A2B4REI5_STYPI|nr:hypothetical protein AWC38_SpisGene21073 [Stylophora pistillata]
MTPAEASKKKNENAVFLKLYGDDLSRLQERPKFAVGDHVRISKFKRKVFEKGFTPNWTEEIFVVDEVQYSNPITYKLKDLLGEEIKGSFYEQEMLRAKQVVFRIEKKMEKHTVVQLRQIAKENGLRGYSKLRKAELINFINQSLNKKVVSERHNLLDDPIPENEIPEEQDILKPSKPVLVKKIDKVVDWGKSKVEDWGQWLKEQVDTPRVVVDDKLKDFKTHIANLYEKRDQYRFKLVEKKSSLKQFAKMYTIDGVGGFEPMGFLQAVKPTVIKFLLTQKNIRVELVLKCNMSKTNIMTGETVLELVYFNSSTKNVFQETDREELYQECVDKMMESLAAFTRNGSGWVVHSVEGLDLHTVKYTPLKGSSYIKLPNFLADKKAIINMKNKDNECFKWCVTRALNPVKKDQERISKTLREQAKKLVWDGIKFPMEVKKIYRFETLNPGIAVNVYMYDGGLNPLRVSKVESSKIHIDLLLITSEKSEKKHYCLIKSLSRLISSDLSKKQHKMFICKRCLNFFGSQKLLDIHSELCRDHEAVREKMPPSKTFLSFQNHYKKKDMPFVIYADFESIIKPLHSVQPNPKECYTEKKQKHIPVSFCYFVKCSFDDRYSKLVEYTAKSEDEDVAQIFVNMLEEEVKAIYKNHPKKEMIFEGSDAKIFENAMCCWLCGEDFKIDDVKVRDHCHYTEGEIDCIPNNEEKYISFTKHIEVDKFFNKKKKEDVVVKRELRFIDSFKFMASSLDKLVNNLTKKGDSLVNTGRYFDGKKLDLLKRKGVYPYEWLNSIDRLDETELPPIESFFSVLSGRGIEKAEYNHAKEVWKTFEMKTMRDYHNLYNKSDVLLLCDVFENFRKVCKENYDLDPCWYYTAPGFAWDACLKMTEIELELLSDPNMLHMFE